MSKQYFFLTSILFVLLLFFVSCSKDDDILLQNNGNTIAYNNEDKFKSLSLDMLDDYLKSQTSGSIVEIKLTDKNIDFEKLSHCLYANKEVKVKLDLSECSATKEIPEKAFCYKSLSKSSKTEEEGVSNLLSVVLPESVDVIGDAAFKNCVGLEKITLPQSLTEIGNSGFSNCTSLSSIEISDGITQLKGYSFENCSSLQTVVIPPSVYEIDYYAFDNCTQLKNVTNNSYSDFPNNNGDNHGSYKSTNLVKTNTITRVENDAITCCNIHDDYFQFDFFDGALFQISLNGEIWFTSECVPLEKFSDTYGVCIRNFAKTDSTIVFELADGEYSTEFAHYIINFNQDIDPEYIDNYSCNRGIYQSGVLNKTVTVTRVENDNTRPCMLFDNYFEFDFDDGAQFQISYDGEIMYTSECVPINEYLNTYGVCIKNFSKTETTLEFELADGEYSSDFAHYVINLTQIVNDDCYYLNDYIFYPSYKVEKAVSITRTDNNAINTCYIYDKSFEFDFNDGAQFRISFDGEIINTSECVLLPQYPDGVCLKNFTKTESTISFDLVDGEYSQDFAHYVVYLDQIMELDFLNNTDNLNNEYNEENNNESNEEFIIEDKGTSQSGNYINTVIITRSDNNVTNNCQIYDTFFEFDFGDGAQFQISFDGEILFTTECSPLVQYKDSYGVSIKNFTKTESYISFDLVDGEYSSDFAHYVVDFNQVVNVNEYTNDEFVDRGTYQDGVLINSVVITRTENNATHSCQIFDTFFEFDFDDGALFQISYDGKILFTTEGFQLEQYNDTYGVSIKNFAKTESSISFDLVDGEYSSDFAHYIVEL